MKPPSTSSPMRRPVEEKTAFWRLDRARHIVETEKFSDSPRPSHSDAASCLTGFEVVQFVLPFTKEFDVDSELVYMHQRWYLAEVGVFLSQAPMPQWLESQYGFANQLPTMMVDPDGRIWHIVIGGVI